MAEISQAAVEARRAYQRRYRREHPEKVKQWQHNFWSRLAEKYAQEDPAASPPVCMIEPISEYASEQPQNAL